MLSRLSLSLFFFRRDWRDEVSAYLDDELTPRERQQLEARLAQSDEMSEYLADLQDMRSMLRGFAPAASAAPFQLTPEIIERDNRTPIDVSSATRALRLSMATAAVGVAAFGAVMVFDVIDSPTVTFTTTSAGDTAIRVPTAQVVTEEVEVELQSDSTAVSEAAQEPGSGEPATPVDAEQMQAEEEAAVTAVEVVEEEQQAAEEAFQAGQEQAEYEQEAMEEEEEQAWQAEEAEADAQAAKAADDPSRRALTAGRERGDSDAQTVTAADVVEQEQTEETVAASEDAQSAEVQAAAVQSSEEESSDAPPAAAAEPAQAADAPAAPAERQSEKRTVVRSVRHVEPDWPLEQRPRSTTVQLASDPAWERPVQIVLAAVAISATVFWLTLAIVDRRRRT